MFDLNLSFSERFKTEGQCSVKFVKPQMTNPIQVNY